jgi:hypothetical protein
MYNKKVLIESLKKLGSAKAPTQKKDIIMNAVRGQWDNPGDITQVPGSKITMGPDPLTGKPLTKPLLGVGSNGQRQMMYPGKDYDFGDAEYVTEYPQMRSGGNKQNHVVVKKSNIQGNGLFINEPIRKGDIIGLAHINNQPTPIVGKNHNHSENNPTAVTISQGNKRYLVAAKDLPAGTEITTNYRLQPELEQPEDFMRNGGMTPTFKKGGGPGDKWLASLVKQATRSNNLLTYPVKLAGERIARLNAFPSRSKQDIIDSLFKKDYEATYFGNAKGTNAGKEKYGFGKRDLIANYFRGIDTGFEPTNYDFDSDAGLEALINEYGPLKAYLMNSQVQHEEPLHARDLLYHRFDKSMPHSEYDYPNMLIRDPNISDNWNYSFHNYDADKTKENFHKLFDLYGKEIIPFDIQPNTSKKPPLFSFDYSPVNPIDNVAGHMAFLQRTPKNEFQLTTRDSWGFFPENYDPKWHMSDKFKQRQTQLMDAFGKPFILTQNNPITFKKGGVHKTKNKNSRSYSRSLDATNKFFAENYLFEKPSSRKNKIYDPHAKYYQKGGASSPEAWGQEIKDLESQIGNPDSWTLEDYYLLQDKLNDYRNWRETTPEGQAVNDSHNEEGEYNIPLPEHLRNYTNAVMKSKLAYANEFGNPAAKRMINLPDNPYQFDNGDTGTHYMASMDNYAVPQIQDENGQLMLGDYGPESDEAIRFDSDEDANYFAEHYKDVAPGFINAKLSPEEIQEYAKGGYIIEDISVPELDKAQYGIETTGKNIIKNILIDEGDLLRSLLYKGINPASYRIKEKITQMPGELYKNTINNSDRAFRTGMALRYGPTELLNKLLSQLDTSEASWNKLSTKDKMNAVNAYDPLLMKQLEDIGQRRLDAWAVGLGQQQEYNTLEQIGEDTYKMLGIEHTPDFFSERNNDIIFHGLKDQKYEDKRDQLIDLSKQHYDLSKHPLTKRETKYHAPWQQTYHVQSSPKSDFIHSIYDNDTYGVRGGYRWDMKDTPEGMHWQANDVWDLHPWEKRSSGIINQSDISKYYLGETFFKPLQNIEALGLVGGKPFNIENNFLVDPKTFKTIKQWENGGEMEYELGDEIDEDTKRKLEELGLGYTFEII